MATNTLAVSSLGCKPFCKPFWTANRPFVIAGHHGPSISLRFSSRRRREILTLLQSIDAKRHMAMCCSVRLASLGCDATSRNGGRVCPRGVVTGSLKRPKKIERAAKGMWFPPKLWRDFKTHKYYVPEMCRLFAGFTWANIWFPPSHEQISRSSKSKRN